MSQPVAYTLLMTGITALAGFDVWMWWRLRRERVHRLVWVLWLVPAIAALSLSGLIGNAVIKLVDPELSTRFTAFYAWRILLIVVPGMTAPTFLLHVLAACLNLKRRSQLVFWGNAAALFGFVAGLLWLYSDIDLMGH